MDKDPGFGVSQFMENARYQHALEPSSRGPSLPCAGRSGARSPRRTAPIGFCTRPQGCERFSILQLKQGRRLEQEQIQAIVNLVASSIRTWKRTSHRRRPAGRLLSSPEGHDQFALREQQYDMIHRLEDDYASASKRCSRRSSARPVRAQVVAQMDMAVTEEAHEQYKPDSQSSAASRLRSP